MNKSTTIDGILNQVRHLEYSEKLNLMERLIRLLRKEKPTTSYKLTDLDGLGSEIWSGIDVNKYIDEQREWD